MTMLRLAARSLLRARWFTVGAALTFALGIGINLAVFASVDRLMFRPLPYADPGRLFLLAQIDQDSGQRVNFMPARYVVGARERLDVIEDMATLGDSSGYYLSPDLAEPEIRLSSVTYRMLDVGGVRPVLGRGFTEADDRSGVRVAVLTWEGWQSRFGGAPDVLDRRIYFRTGSMQIVGVLSSGYIPSGGFVDPDIAGLTNMPEVRIVQNGEQRTLPPTIRLRDGVRREVADAQLAAMASGLDDELGITPDAARSLRLIPIREAMFGRYDGYLLLVTGGAALVLLIASANLAGLFLVRGRARMWEAAVRTSLGATPRRLLFETLAESGIVCLMGVAIALLVLHWSQRAFDAILPAIFARFAVGVDLRLVSVALAAAIAAAVVSAVVPVAILKRLDPIRLLQHGNPGQTPRVRAGRLLLAAEAALGVVLVAGAVVTTRSFSTLASAELGFDRQDLFLINMRPSPGSDPEAQHEFMLGVMEEIRRLPAVVSTGGSPFISVLRTGQAAFGPDGPPCCRWPVTSGYLDTVRVPLLAGRLLGAADYEEGAEVALINGLAAERLWPGVPHRDVVGRIVQFEGEPTRQVVGVVGNTRRAYDDTPAPALYLPLRQGSGLVVARTRPGAGLTYADVRPMVERRGGSLLYVRPMEPMYERLLQAPRFRAALFAAFAGIALLVALVGLHAAAGFDVASRRREIGLRLALGASRAEILRLVVVDACRPVFVGALAGIAIALWAAQYIESFLFSVEAREPVTFVLVAGLQLVTAAAAAYLPARRAAALSPATVLRTT